ncbi:excalibur calcium-binding domain-containing protein [Nocardioides mesophilus]|uniref:Excalibur calcium-binding domain-containing protein n=1 Tax=Nocardioides mesophilus TaxID=433659 RepID=A0A7G9R7W7_9ACTN|nr:excalibur calcium-binding domain-containing protein [Nocardioides mesophilus]QNN51692.1 excalibur calcium-binding domain-containing protein [Nocardioides mesophilus]
MPATKKLAAACAAAVVASTLAMTGAATAHTTGIHDNCTNLNKKWPHGVGTRGAVDKTSGTKVKNFYHNNKAHWAAENHNGTLDRDNDRIACEKA